MNIESVDFNMNLLRGVLWQFESAPALKSLLEDKERWYGVAQQDFWDDWVRDVFDLRTANDFGLSVWARILGISLSVTFEPTPTNVTPFGFGSNNQNFSNSNFARNSQTTVVLSIEQKRLVVQMRYVQLTSRGTVPETNEFLKALFGSEGLVYCLDKEDMSYIPYVFTFEPSAQIMFILNNFDILPRPATVGVRVLVVTRQVFGFGNFNANFSNGSFIETSN